MVRLDRFGNQLWDRTFGGQEDEGPPVVAATSDGGCVVAGASSSGATGNKAAPHLGAVGMDTDCWIVRLNVDGGVVWDKTIGGAGDDAAASVRPMTDGGFLLGGSSSSDPGPWKSGSAFGSEDLWVARLGPAGELVWDKTFGGAESDSAHGLVLTADSGFVVGGGSSSATSGNKRSPGFGAEDMWALKCSLRLVRLGTPVVEVNGLSSRENRFRIPATNAIEVTIRSSFVTPSAMNLFYTLDGTEPSGGLQYGGPFTVDRTVSVSAVAYNDLFDQSETNEPVIIEVVPVYSLAASTAGGGGVSVDPPGGVYLSNDTVTVTASPAPGWAFLRWEGDASSTDPALELTMDQAREVRAVFGAPLGVGVIGAGRVIRQPDSAFYPFGSAVRLSPVPTNEASYFRQWGGSAVGQLMAPLTMEVTNASLSVSAVFASLPANTHSLTVLINGDGGVTKAPQQSNYAHNAAVTLTALPGPGSVLAGWTGEAGGTTNPLPVTMSTNRILTATFTQPPTAVILEPAEDVVIGVAQLEVTIQASDSDGSVARVDLLLDGVVAASWTNPPYAGTLSNLVGGTHALVARASDELGVAGSSDPVWVTIRLPPPRIDSFSPTAAAEGAEVTINGSGFDPVSTNNVVAFGAVRGLVESASESNLVVRVPAGATHAPLTVARAGLSGCSRLYFLPTFAGGQAFDPSSLEPAITLPAPSVVGYLEVGDFDGDGRPDLVTSSYNGGAVSLFQNLHADGELGVSSFGDRVDFLTSHGPFARGDLNGDGWLDLAVAQGSSNLVVVRNLALAGSLGAGSFSPSLDLGPGISTEYVRIRDMDGDGRPELVSGRWTGPLVSLLPNLHEGTELTMGSFGGSLLIDGGGTSASESAAEDLDGDGIPDLMVVNREESRISLRRNLLSTSMVSSASFAPPVGFTTLASPFRTAVADLDGDGRLDICVGSYDTTNISVFRNTSTPGVLDTNSFAARVDFRVGEHPQQLAVGDLNGDGKPDLVVANEGASSVSVLINRATPGLLEASSFAPAVSFQVGSNPISPAVVDLDGDGRPEVVTANFSGSVSILRNAFSGANLPPSVELTNPASGSVLTAPASVLLVARADDLDGAVVRVEFRAGQTTVGVATNQPFAVNWNNLPAGAYALTAVATDDGGLSSTSAPVSVTVMTATPEVVLTGPTNGNIFAAPASILLNAVVSDADNSVGYLDFFNGPLLVGSVTNPPFRLTWTNVGEGTYSLSAVVHDSLGPVVTSAPPVVVTVSLAATNPAVFSWSNLMVEVPEEAGSVTLLVFKNPNSVAASVSYATVNGTAIGGSPDGHHDYGAVQGTLWFLAGQTAAAIPLPIYEDDLFESNQFFRVRLDSPAMASIGGGDTVEVIILDNEVSRLGSRLTRAPVPLVNLASLGSLGYQFGPVGVTGAWRLAWGPEWIEGGTALGGLAAGLFEVQFKPVNGYQAPARMTVLIEAGQTQQATAYYTNSTLTQGGSLRVELEPLSVATNAILDNRGQWRLAGSTQWHDGGDQIDALGVDSYVVEFKDITGWSTPSAQAVTVEANRVESLTAHYYHSTAVPGNSDPLPLGFEELNQTSYGAGFPYGYCGQLKTDLGWSSGTVVLDRVVLTAAHAVFNDVSLSYVPAGGVTWHLQRHRGVYEPAPIKPRGWCVLDGYAAARLADATPGISTVRSQDRDVAALYFGGSAGAGGYSGYVVSQSPAEEWLYRQPSQTLVGYPVEGVGLGQRGIMHATPIKAVTWVAISNQVHSTTNIRSFPGNSGGPLCVLFTNGIYYPAAVYLGGSGQTVVRAIDREVAEVLGCAEAMGDAGQNSTGGDPLRLAPGEEASPIIYGFVTIHLVPADIGDSSGGFWFRESTQPHIYSGPTNRFALLGGGAAVGESYTVDFVPVAGYVAPAPVVVAVTTGAATNVYGRYQAFGRLLPGERELDAAWLLGSSGSLYRVEFRPSLDGGAPWSGVWTQRLDSDTVLLPGLRPSPMSSGFLRAVLLP